MKLNFYAIVMVTLLAGCLALPSNLMSSTDDDHISTYRQEKKPQIETKEESLNEVEENNSVAFSFPLSAEKQENSEDKEQEISPRVLEEGAKAQEYNSVKIKCKNENVEEKDDKISAMSSKFREDKNKNQAMREKEITAESMAKTFQILEVQNIQIPEPQNQDKVESQKAEEIKLAESNRQEKPQNPAISQGTSLQTQNSELMPTLMESWNDFDDGKFSLLENRLPDLTEEEVREINKEGAIPLSFLKRVKTSKTKKAEASKNVMPLVASKPETPVFITIPIVINTHSSLPISLSFGGQTIALDQSNKMTDLATPSM